jgi:hypothetical protein
MARFEKGHERLPGAGRRLGSANKATRNAREAIARFVDDNAPRLQSWLDQIAETEGPLAAFKCVHDLIEFHVPKLSRAELTVDRPERKKNIIDSSKLTWEERQALKAIISRSIEREQPPEGRLIEADGRRSEGEK